MAPRSNGTTVKFNITFLKVSTEQIQSKSKKVTGFEHSAWWRAETQEKKNSRVWIEK
jgi:hypothetical protein